MCENIFWSKHSLCKQYGNFLNPIWTSQIPSAYWIQCCKQTKKLKTTTLVNLPRLWQLCIQAHVGLSDKIVYVISNYFRFIRRFKRKHCQITRWHQLSHFTMEGQISHVAAEELDSSSMGKWVGDLQIYDNCLDVKQPANQSSTTVMDISVEHRNVLPARYLASYWLRHVWSFCFVQ